MQKALFQVPTPAKQRTPATREQSICFEVYEGLNRAVPYVRIAKWCKRFGFQYIFESYKQAKERGKPPAALFQYLMKQVKVEMRECG